MLRKITILILMLVATGCSAFPVEISIRNNSADVQKPVSNDTALISSNPLKNSQDKLIATCPAACPQPVCPQPIWPTCPACSAAAATTTVVPSSTATLKPSSTPTKTQVPPTATATRTPTFTMTPSRTSTATAVTMPYAVQPSTPLYGQNFAHVDQGCSWLGVAGQVFDRSSNPTANLVLVAEGVLAGKQIDVLGLTGLNSVYGPGGYELVLSNKTIASTGTVSLTLYDLSGKVLSAPVFFNTYTDCAKNLVVINFKQK